MCATFTDDDVGKTVMNASDDEVGIVAAVEHGTAHVEPDPGVTDTIKAKLGWGGTDEEAYPLQEQAVDHIGDDHIHLKGDLSGMSGADAGTGAGTTDTGTGTGTDTDMGDDTGMGSDRGVGDDSGMTDDDSGIGDDSGITDDDDGLTDDDSGFGDDDDGLTDDDGRDHDRDDDDDIL